MPVMYKRKYTRRFKKSRVSKKTPKKTYKKTSYKKRYYKKSSPKVVKQNNIMENENRVVNLKVNAYKPSPFYMLKALFEPQWFRVSGLNLQDNTVGFQPIANRTEPSGVRCLPMHVYDLTSMPNVINGTFTDAPTGYGMFLDSVLPNANVSIGELNSQNEDGTQRNFNSKWISENTSDTVDIVPRRKAFHEYSHIKLNLYGVRKRATKFYVQLVQMKETGCDFLTAAGTNLEKKKLVDYMVRPLIYNNLNGGDIKAREDFKILKSFETTIAPIKTDEYSGATSTPHIVTLNWFIKHNKLRDFSWFGGDTPGSGQVGNFDRELGQVSVRVHPHRRLYLVVRAESPEIRTLSAGQLNWQISADPISEPSYDFVIRNKFQILI